MSLKGVVIGSSVESLLYSLVKGHHHLNNSSVMPMFYENLNVGLFGERNKKKVWTRLNLINSFLAKNIIVKDISQIRILDDMIKISNGNKVSTYRFQKCYIFDKENVIVENDVITIVPAKYRVIDDFEIKNLGKSIKTIESNLGEGKIYFYTSDRIDGANYITDCVLESILSESELHQIEYSDVAKKFFVQKYLLKSGLRGKIVAKDKNNNPKFLKPEATHKKRLVFPIDETVYKDSDTVKFPKLSVMEIINEEAN